MGVKLFTTKAELAEQIGFSIRFLEKIPPSELPRYKIGHSVRYRQTDVDNWLARHRIGERVTA